ncbi:hypothetical protein B0T14DRAFT_76289 [Immersiella caudata]|uniref:Uncharacterized protein n=1 Tax=Immersiella caudata TaxID=314043 RepID=A0AA39XGL3_9PEZI|nr:hypothetical protein B0T14DRAFT_76289 [Immersiella caudata]
MIEARIHTELHARTLDHLQQRRLGKTWCKPRIGSFGPDAFCNRFSEHQKPQTTPTLEAPSSRELSDRSRGLPSGPMSLSRIFAIAKSQRKRGVCAPPLNPLSIPVPDERERRTGPIEALDRASSCDAQQRPSGSSGLASKDFRFLTLVRWWSGRGSAVLTSDVRHISCSPYPSSQPESNLFPFSVPGALSREPVPVCASWKPTHCLTPGSLLAAISR